MRASRCRRSNTMPRGSLTRACRAMLPEIFNAFDVLVAPSAIGDAPAGIAATGDPLFNRIWTLLHVPVVHVPVADGSAGIAGRRQRSWAPSASDRATLRAAEWIHARLGGSGQDRRSGTGRSTNDDILRRASFPMTAPQARSESTAPACGDRSWTWHRSAPRRREACARLALTDLDGQGRDLVVGWLRETGSEHRNRRRGQHLRDARRAR